MSPHMRARTITSSVLIALALGLTAAPGSAIADVVTGAPVISGIATVDNSLTLTTGTLSQSFDASEVEWFVGGHSAQLGSVSFLVRADAVGFTIMATVTMPDSAEGTVTLSSQPTATVAERTLNVSVSEISGPGSPVLENGSLGGGEMSVDARMVGVFYGDEVFTYEWSVDGTKVPGTTSPTYLVTLKDSGSVLSVDVTVSCPGCVSVTVSRSTKIPLARFNLGYLEYTRRQDSAGWPVTLRLSGASAPRTVDPLMFTTRIVWTRNGAVIAGQHGHTYKLRMADHGSLIRARITLSKRYFETVTLQTEVLDFTYTSGDPGVGPPPGRHVSTLARPTVSGSAKVGKTLVAHSAGWKKYSEITVTYQWYRASAAISGATHARYKVRAADRGSKLSVRATASTVDLYIRPFSVRIAGGRAR